MVLECRFLFIVELLEVKVAKVDFVLDAESRRQLNIE